MAKERRKYQRVTIKSAAEITDVSTQQRVFAFIGDIGRGGLELYCQHAPAINRSVTIRMTFLSRQGKELSEELSGTIRWISKLGEAFIAGIEFTRPIIEDEHPALWGYIEQYVPRPPS